MKLEDQVVSLELAKKLKELGVKQESLFYWGFDVDPSNPGYYDEPSIIHKSDDYRPIASAFNVAELGEMLPDEFYTVRHDKDSHWICISESLKVADNDETEANARAKCLIYLLENKLIDLSSLT